MLFKYAVSAGGVVQCGYQCIGENYILPNASEVGIAIGKLKRYKSPSVGSDPSRTDSDRRENIVFGDS
jgi:hypothetical protein